MIAWDVFTAVAFFAMFGILAYGIFWKRVTFEMPPEMSPAMPVISLNSPCPACGHGECSSVLVAPRASCLLVLIGATSK